MHRTTIGVFLACGLHAAHALNSGESFTLDPATGDYVITFVGNNGIETSVYEPGTKINPFIASSFETAPDGWGQYRYVVHSLGDSRQLIERFWLDPVANIKARRDLTRSREDMRADAATRLDRMRACVEAIQKPAGWTLTCGFTLLGTSPGLNLSWREPREAPGEGIESGQMLAGFGFSSSALPGMRPARLQGKTQWWKQGRDPTPGDDDTYTISKDLDQRLTVLSRKERDGIRRWVAVPAFEMPAPFSGIPILIDIRSHVGEWPSQKLMDNPLWTKVDAFLRAAVGNLEDSVVGPGAAVANLAQVRVELRKKYPDLDLTTVIDDPATRDLPALPDPLSAFLSAHDQRLAAKVLDFDVGSISARLGAGDVPYRADGTIQAPSADGDGSFSVTWGRPISRVQTVCGPVSTNCKEVLMSFVLEVADNSAFAGSRSIYEGPRQEFAVTRYGPGAYYFRVKARMLKCLGPSSLSWESWSCSSSEPGAEQAFTGYYAIGPNVTVVAGR